MKKILLIGDSPLSFFLAKQLDQDLARHAHLRVGYLTRDAELVHLMQAGDVLGRNVWPRKVFEHVRTLVTQVKSINLKERRVVTANQILSYDYLVLDLQPMYTTAEIDRIAQGLNLLARTMVAALNTGKKSVGVVRVSGSGITSAELALKIEQAIRQNYPALSRRLTLETEAPTDDVIAELLKANGIQLKAATKQPGLAIDAPLPPVKPGLLKGVRLDRHGQPINDGQGGLTGYPEVICLPSRPLNNLLRTDQAAATQVIDRLKDLLVNNAYPQPVHQPKKSFLANLTSWRGGSVGRFG